MLEIKFKRFRHVSWIAIICSLFGSMLMFTIGAMKTYHAFSVLFLGAVPKSEFDGLASADIATTYLIMSLDAFLIALVLFIFAYGIYSLFINNYKEMGDNDVLSWIDMPSISHLKSVLAEVIIVILFVKFLEIALINIQYLTWTILVLPSSILMLAISLKLLNLKDKN
jgi:uncharacterized membrane protein YqhA